MDGVDEQRDFEENVTVTAQPVEGKTFTGWEVTGLPADVDTTKATISFKMPANNVTLKAQYTENAPKTYKLDVTDAKVTLKDGSDVADLTAVRVGTELVATAPEKDGYTFTGWEVTGLPADVDTTKATISFKMPANKVTLKAQYTENAPKTYKLDVTDAKVTLKDGSDVADLTAVRVGTELVATADEKDGYTFTGWEKEGLPADVDTTKATISFTMPANKVTLKAQYKKNTYTLTVDGVDEQRDFEENVTVTAQPVEGKTFTGWEVTGLPTDVDTTKATISFKMPANKVTLKAQYKKNTYTLTVDGVDEQRDFEENVTVTAQPVEGKTFTGWEVTGLPTDVDTTKATISFKMPANKVTLKAQYKKNTYTLTVDGVDEQRDFEENVTVTAQPVEGKTFTGWEVTGLPADVDTTKATISFKMPANNVTLKAQYTENAPKTYKLDVTDAKVTLKDGGAVADLTAVPVGTELVATAPEKEGYTFDSWEKDGLPADAKIDGANITFKMPANNVTLKAKYIENAPETYELKVTDAKVTLKDGGAVADLTAVPVGTELVVTAPEKVGYTFDGWEKNGLPADANIDGATITFKMPANKVTLKAKYIENTSETYTVTMGEEVTVYAVGADVTVIAPAKAGETFTGWDAVGVPEGTDTNSETITFKMPKNNVTLTPQYKKDSTPTPAPGGDSDGGGAAIVAVAAVGGAAIGVGAYIAGTTAYLKSVLPEGMAIPANRQQLAVALWTAAGKPATQSTALFNDVAADAAELQAIRWVVETGLMSAQDGSFKPGSRVGRMEVIRTWKTYQQRG